MPTGSAQPSTPLARVNRTMKHLTMVLAFLLLVVGAVAAREHKTHSSLAPAAKITMVHYGATW